MVKLILRIGALWCAVIVAVMGGGLLSVYYAFNSFGACKNAVLNTLASPDGSKVVVIFRKECNATVPYSMQASLAPANLASPAEKVPPFFVVKGTATVMAAWRGNHTINIAVVPAGSTVFRSQESVGDIKIEYK
jgi:hypothetical protein